MKLEPKNYYSFLVRAYAQEGAGKFEAALADLEEARQRNDKVAEIYREKAFCLLNLKKFNEAIAEASTAIREERR